MDLPTAKETRRNNLAMVVAAWRKEGRKARDLAIQLDLADSYLSQMVTGHRNIGDDTAAKLEERLRLRRGALDSVWPSWEEVRSSSTFALEAARGEVRDASADYAAITTTATSWRDEGRAEVLVRFYPRIRAAAGVGAINTDNSEPLHLKFRAESLRRRGINANTAIIYASGDSMEPLIGNDDTIMFDTSKTDIVDGKLYVIEVDNEALVKRLHRRPGARVLVQSENTAYPAYEVPIDADGFKVLGRVMWRAGWLS